MTSRPLLWRPTAMRDGEELAAYYFAAGGMALEIGFLDALDAAFELISDHPDSGSTGHADLFPELPKPLRFHPLRRFDRILVYYAAFDDRVEIIRIWDAARGLDALLDDGKE